MFVIVTNHVNWHRENLQLDRENTGNLKMQFEWVPCIMHMKSPYRYTFRFASFFVISGFKLKVAKPCNACTFALNFYSGKVYTLFLQPPLAS